MGELIIMSIFGCDLNVDNSVAIKENYVYGDTDTPIAKSLIIINVMIHTRRYRIALWLLSH